MEFMLSSYIQTSHMPNFQAMPLFLAVQWSKTQVKVISSLLKCATSLLNEIEMRHFLAFLIIVRKKK